VHVNDVTVNGTCCTKNNQKLKSLVRS